MPHLNKINDENLGCVLIVGGNVLVDITNHVSLNYDKAKYKDPKTAFLNIVTDKKVKCSVKDIEELDISKLCSLLRNKKLNLFVKEKCCGKCKHVCGCPDDRKCKGITECEREPCTNCDKKAKDCKYIVYEICVVTIKDTRNCKSHKAIKQRNDLLSCFPYAHTWHELWKCINNGIHPCLELLKKEGAISEDKYWDYRMDMRIALKKDPDECIKLYGTLLAFYTIKKDETNINDDNRESQRFQVYGRQNIVEDYDQVEITKKNIKKIENGLVVRFIPDEIKDMSLKLVKIRSNKDMIWIQHDYPGKDDKIVYEDRCLTVRALNIERHDLKVGFVDEKVGFVDENVEPRLFIYEIHQIEIVGKRELEHVTNNSARSSLVMCHAYGEPHDLHQMIKTDYATTCHQPVSRTDVLYYKGGSISANLSHADNYMERNFKEILDKGGVIMFPPYNLVPEEQQTTFDKLKGRIKMYYEKQYNNKRGVCVVLTQYSTQKHFHHVQIEPKKYHIEVVTDDSNRIIVFDREKKAIINLRISDSIDGLEESNAACHEDLKALYLLHCDLIKDGKAAIIGLVATDKMERKDVNKNHFCKLNTCLSLVISKNELIDQPAFDDWWSKLLDHDLYEELRKRLMHHKYDQLEGLNSVFLQVPNRMMVVMSLDQYCLPAVDDYVDDHERKFLWNKDQHKAINDEWKKKVIKGPFGSGKSLVALRIVKDFLLNPNNKGILYVITWDPYSLMSVEHENSLSKLKKQEKIEIVCKTIVEISQEKGDERVISLFECLEYLNTTHSEPLHFLLDEFDIERLTEEDAEKINQMTSSGGAYEYSMINLVLQSLEKQRTIPSPYHDDRSKSDPITMIKSMRLYQLPTAMRSTNSVYKVIECSQSTISKQANVYNQPSININVTTNEQQPVSPSKAQSEVESLPSPPLDHTSVQSKVIKWDPSIDRLINLSNENQEKGEVKLITKFIFPTSNGCGSRIEGGKPDLIRLPSNYITANEDNVSMLVAVFEYWLESYNQQSLFICNSTDIANLITHSLESMGVDYVNYLYGLGTTYPTAKDRRDVYNSWKGDKNMVLLTDNRGVCGLEHEKVVVFFDESQYPERYLISEAMSRSTTKLLIVSFESKKHKSLSSMKDVIDDLVTNHSVHDIKTDINQNRNRKELKTPIRKELKNPLTEEQANNAVVAKFRSARNPSEVRTFHELKELLRKNEIEVFIDLIKLNPDCAKLVNNFGNNLLHVAAQYNRTSAIDVLIEHGCDIHGKNADGRWTAFHWAAKKNSVETMKKFINHINLNNEAINDAINAVTEGNLTPLHIAAQSNNKEIVLLLLNQDSIDVNTKAFLNQKMADEQEDVTREIKELIKKHRN